jgi:hypothetical protein
MRTEYRVDLVIVFSSQADRDAWYDKIKQSIGSLKATLASFNSAVLTKDDSLISERASENI